MMLDNRHDLAGGAFAGELCKGLAWRQWDTVLGCSRRKQLPGRCWLQTYSEPGEIFAMFTSGHVGLLPVPSEVENKCQMHLGGAPAIIELSNETVPSLCHWVADQADVYFYSQAALLAAFAASPAFGCNFVKVLCAQQAKITKALDDPASLGVKRLARSLLARADEKSGSYAKVSVTQAELAFESGLSRQWVNRLLRGLEKRGVTRLERGFVVLASMTMLREYL